MNSTQNVTLSIPKDVLRKAKLLAVQKNTSLSRLLSDQLIELVEHADVYEQAARRNLSLVREGIDLNTQGQIPWGRAELHDRS